MCFQFSNLLSLTNGDMTMAVEWSSGWAGDARAEEVARAKNAAQGGGGSTLMKLALALGTIADNLVEKVLAKAKELDAAAGKGGNENLLTAEMQALTQIMKMFQEAMSTAIKSMGEGNTSTARKS
ncbi:MAG: hypothetical protein KA124_06915 [Luteimonas sp.]|nr:hypothetical protein [Luteimonas sp.]